MQKLSSEYVKSLALLANLDSQGINLSFSISKTLGLAYLSSCITDFANFLKRKHGDIILSYSGEYRIYIVNLLEEIEDKYKPNVINELINPKIKEMTGIEFLEIIQQAKIDKTSGVNNAEKI